MLNSFLETDFIAKGLPSISEVDLENKSLIEQLEYCNIHYLIYLYSTKTHYKKSLRLLQKFIKKNSTNVVAIEQILLTCIKFNDQKLLEMNMNVYKRYFSKHLDKIKIFESLRSSIINTEDQDIIFYNNKCIEIFNKLFKGDKSFTLQSFIVYKNYDSNFFMDIDNRSVYNYKCNTEEYSKILLKCRDYLLYHLDINILFLYSYISRLGCLLNKCDKKCSTKKDKELRDILLNDLYLIKLGLEDREFLVRFYKRKKDIKEDIDFLQFEEVEPTKVSFIAKIHEKKLREDSKYVCNKKSLLSKCTKIYDDELYSGIGTVYTREVRRYVFEKEIKKE